MDRRNYLAVVATAAVAGCTDAQPGEDPTENETEPDADSEPPTTEPESEPEPELESPPDDEAEPDEREQFASQQIEAGDTLLDEALTVYAEAVDGESFLDVRASTTFKWVTVSRRVAAANDAFDHAHQFATDSQRDRITRLRRVGAMIRASARTQESLGNVFPVFGDVIVAHQGDTVSPVAWRTFRDRLDLVTTRLDAVTAAGSASDAEASEALTVEAYEQKVDQLQAEHDAFQRVLDARDSFSVGHDKWLRAEWQYRNQSWSTASQRFDEAVTNFDTAVEKLARDAVGDERFDRRYRTFRQIADSLSEAAVEYRESATAYNNRNRQEGDDRRRAGRRILRNEDAIDTMPSVRRLELFEPN